VKQTAGDFGLTVRTIRVPPHYERDTAFLKAVLASLSDKCILVVSDQFYPAFILQALTLYGASFLLLHPDFICPEFVELQGMPSLAGSLQAFLDGKHSARTHAGPDTGWTAAWRQLGGS
jgi:hypothetical protein